MVRRMTRAGVRAWKRLKHIKQHNLREDEGDGRDDDGDDGDGGMVSIPHITEEDGIGSKT